MLKLHVATVTLHHRDSETKKIIETPYFKVVPAINIFQANHEFRMSIEEIGEHNGVKFFFNNYDVKIEELEIEGYEITVKEKEDEEE